MPKNSRSEVFTVGIGGAAGDGVMEAGSTLGQLLRGLGYKVYMSTGYPSLIRGGHNFARLSFSKEKVWCDYRELDVLIALNEETIKLHANELLDGAAVFADAFDKDDVEKLGSKMIFTPMSYSVKKFNFPPITRSSVSLGALCFVLDFDLKSVKKFLAEIFVGKKPEVNIKLAEIGFDHLRDKNFKHGKKIEPGEANGEFLDGNTAYAKGLQAAGLDFYFAYPMTPSSTILHYLAARQTRDGLKVVQPENEISVTNMALGAAYAGKRAAIGTATGGFALMQEALSFAGGAELPISMAISQRQAPATGVPTHSSQSDLRFALHGGHGEFPRIVMAPGDGEECFRAGELSLNLAWKFQTPVIVLLDKILSEHAGVCSPDYKSVFVDRGKTTENPDKNYGRYEFVDDGISPLAFPGAKNATVKVTSYEHDQNGLTTENPTEVKKMLDKRFAKIKSIEQDMLGRETIKIFGDAESENAVVFFGSTKGAVLEAAKYFEKPAKLLQVIWLEPFPAEKIKNEIGGAKKIICVEGNHDAQLAGLIRQKTGIVATDKILKYDSSPFDPIDLAEKINSILK